MRDHMWYVSLRGPGDESRMLDVASEVFFGFVSAFILYHSIIPISLTITVEGVKFIQSYFLSWDFHMYDTLRDRPAKTHLSALNEELGQVQYIFSDKTGTLTQNVMRFRACSIAGSKYSFTYVLSRTPFHVPSRMSFRVSECGAECGEPPPHSAITPHLAWCIHLGWPCVKP